MTEIEKGNLDAVTTLCWQLLIIIVVSAIFVGIRATSFNAMSQRIALDLRHDFFKAVVNQDVEFFENNKTGDLLSRLNADIDVIQDSMSSNVSMFMRCFVSIIAIIIILFVLQPLLAVTFFVGFVPMTFFALKFGSVMKGIAVKISDKKGRMSSIADESLSNVRTVKAFANEGEEIRKFNLESDAVFQMGK